MTAATDRVVAYLLRRARFPRTARTVRQRVLWLAREGYILTAYWLAKANIHFAAGPVRPR